MEATEPDGTEAPTAQAITLDGAPAALVTEPPLGEPNPGDAQGEDYRYDDLEYDADTVTLPNGLEVTLRGLCQAAAFARGLATAQEWNALDMPTRQDAVAEMFVQVVDALEAEANRAMAVQIVPPIPTVTSLDAARALPLQPDGTVAERVEHHPGTVVRFKEPDGTTMVVVVFNGQLYKTPADEPMEA